MADSKLTMKSELVELGKGDYGRTDWGETDRKKNPHYRKMFNEKRWANVAKEIDAVKKCWSNPNHPMWAMITVETGYGSVVKVGFICKPKHPHASITKIIHERGQQFENMIRGAGEYKSHKGTVKNGDGDMDVFCQIHGMDELTVEHIKQAGNFMRVVEEDTDPCVGTYIHHVEHLNHLNQALAKRMRTTTDGEPAKGMEPMLGTHGGAEPDFAAITSKCRKDLEDAKKLGLAKVDLIKLVEDIFDEPPSAGADGACASQAELKRSKSALESDLELVRGSTGVAWIAFSLV